MSSIVEQELQKYMEEEKEDEDEENPKEASEPDAGLSNNQEAPTGKD